VDGAMMPVLCGFFRRLFFVLVGGLNFLNTPQPPSAGLMMMN
jgi:hypothetical protein